MAELDIVQEQRFFFPRWAGFFFSLEHFAVPQSLGSIVQKYKRAPASIKQCAMIETTARLEYIRECRAASFKKERKEMDQQSVVVPKSFCSAIAERPVVQQALPPPSRVVVIRIIPPPLHRTPPLSRSRASHLGTPSDTHVVAQAGHGTCRHFPPPTHTK